MMLCEEVTSRMVRVTFSQWLLGNYGIKSSFNPAPVAPTPVAPAPTPATPASGGWRERSAELANKTRAQNRHK